MSRKNKLILLVLVYFLFFGWRWCTNLLFFFHGEGLFSSFGFFQAESAYNELLVAKGGDPLALEVLRRDELRGREADRAELLGDALYVQSGAREEILSWYERSLSYEDRARVRSKRDSLALSGSVGASLSATGSGEGQKIEEVTGSGMSDALKDAFTRVSEDRDAQGKYLAHPGQNFIIQETIDFLDLDRERIDW